MLTGQEINREEDGITRAKGSSKSKVLILPHPLTNLEIQCIIKMKQNKIKSGSKNPPQNAVEKEKEIPKERYISPKKKKQIIDELRLVQ